MYELRKLFKDSAYNSAVFSYEVIRAVEDLIYVKDIKGVEVPYIKCQIRDKEIKLTPEEAVRQLYIYKLIHEYGYDKSCIELERAIHFGREVKRADIVILEQDPFLVRPEEIAGIDVTMTFCAGCAVYDSGVI